MVRFPRYGTAGITIIVLAEILLAAGVLVVGVYFTPIVWTGYILFVDALNVSVNGSSLITTRKREFSAMLPWSVICWLIFEAYNLRLRNWTYVGLPEDEVLRIFGYVWSFATIFPAILETAELLGSLFARGRKTISGPPPAGPGTSFVAGSIVLGVLCLVVPLVLPVPLSGKLFGLIWIGFIFVLDPISARRGGRSLMRQILRGETAMVLALGTSGLVCGLLWEFWNYWAVAKWVYNVPIAFVGPKIFEMPLLGFLGFIPFALECYVMQEFLLTLIPSLSPGRTP